MDEKEYELLMEEMANNSPDPINKPNQEVNPSQEENRYNEFLPELFNDIDPIEQQYTRETDFEEDYVPDQFAYDFSEVEDVNELQAQLQPWSHKAGAFVGRTASKAVVEFVKGFGYLAGVPGALATQDIEVMTNNFFIDLLNEVDESVKEALPVYVKNSVRDGSLGTKLMSMDFWANEGADGLGFLLSSIGIGGVMSKLGNLAKLSNAANIGVTSAVQTLVEAAAETSGMSTQLDNYWAGRKQQDGTYLDEKNNVLTEQQVKNRKAEALHSTFIQNGLLLAGPNLVMSNSLFGKANPVKNMLTMSRDGLRTIPKNVTTSLDDMMTNLSSVTPWKQGVKKTAAEMLKVGSSEAFQELSQFAIEDYNSKLAKNLTNDNLISGLWKSYEKGLTEVDGQASMALGFLFGAGASTIGTYKKNKADAKKRKGLSELISTANDSYRGALRSIYKINEEGNYEIDNSKVADIIESNIKDLSIDDRYKKARAQGETGAARLALGQIVLRTMQPFLEQSEGMDVFNQLIEENSETYENDYADLGFNNVEEMKQYINSVAQEAKAEHDNFQKNGYHKFNINKKVLYRGKENAETIDQVYGAFLNKMSGLNQTLVFNRNRLLEARNEASKRLAEERDKLVMPDPNSENYEQEVEKMLSNNKVVSAINSELRKIDTALSRVNDDYQKLYDPKEHEKAFDHLYFSRLAIEEAAQEDIEARDNKVEMVNSFYDNLREKGYTLVSDGMGNDITKGAVSLVDNDGNVYITGKGKLTPNGEDKFIIKNAETNEIEEFTADMIVNKFPEASNILSKEDFRQWKNTRKLVNKYEKAVQSINQLIGPVEGGRLDEIINQRKSIFRQQESLKFYEEYLQELKGEVPSKIRSVKDISDEIDIVEKEISRLEESISDMNEKLEILEESLELLEQIEREYLEGIATFEAESRNKPMSKMLESLQGQFESDEISESIDLIKDGIDNSNKILDSLKDQHSYMSDLASDLYFILANNPSLDTILDELSPSSIRKISEILNLKEDNSDLIPESLRGLDVFGNVNERYQVLNIIKADRGDLWHTYNLINSEINQVSRDIKRTESSLSKLNKNKDIRLRYDQLAKDIASLNAIFKGIKVKEQTENFRKLNGQNRNIIEQNDSEHVNDYKSKSTPYSTTTSVYKFKDGKVVLDSNGNKVKSDNWEQAVRWSKAMMNVDLNKLGEYELEFLNNKGLEAINIKPPSNNEDDLYVVLKRNNDPIIVDGNIAFTGIAFSSTYFNQPEARINLSKNSEYLNALETQKQVDAGKLPSFEHEIDGNNFDSLKDVEDYLTRKMEEEYSDWRKDTLNKLSNGERLYTNITDVSKGNAVITDQRNKPKEVFGEISEIIIPRRELYGKRAVDVAPGMVYVQNSKGHIKRVLNKRIDSLPSNEQSKFINSIIKFISLSIFAENKINENFRWKNSKSTTTLLGSKNRSGILDYFINWGDSNKNWAINIGRSKKDGELQIRITNGVTDNNRKPLATFINVRDLFDGDIRPENVRKSNDPAIAPLVDFLKTKYMNVDSNSINKDLPNGFWVPVDWELQKGEPVIVADKKRYKSYNDYVLDKVVYTNVGKYDASTDKIPNFVNQYAIFDKNDITSKQKEVEKKSLKELRKEGGKANVSKEIEQSLNDDFRGFEENKDSNPSGFTSFSSPRKVSEVDEQFNDFVLDAFNQEETKEDCDTPKENKENSSSVKDFNDIPKPPEKTIEDQLKKVGKHKVRRRKGKIV